MSPYAVIGAFLLVGLALPAVTLVGAWVFSPKKPNPIKQDIYECGLETVGETWVQFKVQYYIYALVFVIFDIETVFLYPWAVSFDALGLFGFVEMVLFIVTVFIAYTYVWRRGGLNWD